MLMLKVQEGPLVKKLKAELNDLLKQLTPDLPPAPNGVAWTVDDLDALALEVKAVNADIRREHGGN